MALATLGAVLWLLAAAGPAAAATTLDISGCPAANLATGTLQPPLAVRTGTCSVLFGDSVGGSDLRIHQTDGVGTAMAGFADHSGTATWTLGTSMFGACLESVSGGAAATWTAAGDADCATSNADPWRPVATTSGAGLVATSAPATTGTARLRFGMRAAASHPPGAYTAPITIEVIATTVNTPPTAPALVSPADSAVGSASQLLTATFDDPDAGDTGQVLFEVCNDASCASIARSGTSTSGLADGANGSYTATSLTAGTQYWWRARNQDSASALSGWSTIRTFTVNSATAPTLASPADLATVSSTPTLSATFADPNAGQTGTINFRIASNSACTTVVQSGTSAAGIAIGANGTWTPAALTPGTQYWWCATSTDSMGATSALSSIRTFTVNSTTAPTLVSPAAGATGVTTTATLSATFTDPQAGQTGTIEFRVASDAGCTTAVRTGSSAAGIAIGANGTWAITPALASGTTYYWCARSTDSVGGVSAWSAPRTFTTASAGCTGQNTAAPTVSPSGTVASGTLLTGTNGSWSCSPSSYTYQWFRCGAPITGATAITYTTVVADRGNSLHLRVTAVSGGGNGTANSGIVFVSGALAVC